MLCNDHNKKIDRFTGMADLPIFLLITGIQVSNSE